MHSSLHIQRINHITCTTTTSAACSSLGSHQKQTKPSWVYPVSGEISVPENVLHHHTHAVAADQCCSAVVQSIDAPVETVWSIVRRFDKPQMYKQFLKSCHVVLGDGEVGTLREVRVVSGLPAVCSRERLDILDDEKHVISFSVVGGDHRLHNYRSVTTVLHLHDDDDESNRTVVVESYVVDVPTGNTKDETCAFVDTIVRSNLLSLAQIAQNLAKNETKLSQL